MAKRKTAKKAAKRSVKRTAKKAGAKRRRSSQARNKLGQFASKRSKSRR